MWACNLCNLCEPVICISASAVNLSRSRLLRFSADQLFLAKHRAKWIYKLVARAVCEPRIGPSELQTRISHLYLCISDGVRHDVIQWLTSRCIFVSRQHSTESDFEFPLITKALMKRCLFIVCQTMFTIGESQAISHANRTANTRTPNCQSSQGKIWHRKILWSEERRLEIQRRKQQRWMEMVATNSGAERTSLNEFQMLKFFKSKWKRFWIISLINIWANIAVTKHVLLADEFVPYRPRLLGFHFLRVNSMKCIYVGFSMAKLQSFFWKISLNSSLIRLEGFSNKNPRRLCGCSTWPNGKALTRCGEGPEFESGQYLFLFASFLFFFFFLFFSFSFHFRYNSFVMFLYIAHNFWLTNFLLGFTCLSPKSLARSWDLRIFSKLLIDRRLKLIFFRLFLKSHTVLF